VDDERRGGEKEAGDADEGRESDAAVPLIRVDNGADEPNERHQLSIINIKQRFTAEFMEYSYTVRPNKASQV